MALAARMECQVKQERQRMRVSQEWLAREVGVSRQTIVNVERAATVPNVLLAIAIANALGVPIHNLFQPVRE